MFKFRCAEKKSSLFKILKNGNVRILNKETRKRSFLGHVALSVNKLNERKVVSSADSGVVLTECRRNVNYTCTV